jgi:hypothetical protein
VPHIRLIDPDDATGPLEEEYEAAVERAGKVYNIVRSMSLNPAVLRQSMELYKAIMFGPSGPDAAGAGAARDGRLGDQRVLLLTALACRRPP